MSDFFFQCWQHVLEKKDWNPHHTFPQIKEKLFTKCQFSSQKNGNAPDFVWWFFTLHVCFSLSFSYKESTSEPNFIPRIRLPWKFFNVSVFEMFLFFVLRQILNQKFLHHKKFWTRFFSCSDFELRNFQRVRCWKSFLFRKTRHRFETKLSFQKVTFWGSLFNKIVNFWCFWTSLKCINLTQNLSEQFCSIKNFTKCPILILKKLKTGRFWMCFLQFVKFSLSYYVRLCFGKVLGYIMTLGDPIVLLG